MRNAPELQLGLDVFYEAYMDLSSCRSGMGDGPIPWTVVMDYAQLQHMDEEMARELWFYITQMDEAWLTYQEKKRDKP